MSCPPSWENATVKRTSGRRVRQTYQFIEAHRHQFPVEVMCRILEVAPSGYYEWLKHPFPIALRRTHDSCALFGLRSSRVTESMELHAYFSICARRARHAANIELKG